MAETISPSPFDWNVSISMPSSAATSRRLASIDSRVSAP
jgi:hypothetical protein